MSSLKKGLEAEVAMDSRKTSIGKHREGNMGLNGGHLRERDYSAESSPANVKKSQASRAEIILYIIAVTVCHVNSSY